MTHTPGLEPVAPQWCHVTVLHSGPVEEVSDEEIRAITGRVRERCAEVRPFELALDRPVVGNVALECPGRPGAPARRLWEITARAGREVLGDRYPLLPAAYYPHLSVAYAGRQAAHADRTALKALLSDIPAGPVSFHVDRLHLVAQSHDGRQITWRPVTTVLLGES
ncbi:2'-5' RNA ligase family protein [Streptomyces klenkii]|uniref:2'-5' RNA ligase family protein n=1 Tax=Streptomyces klenkii TaxID=1420899 RepID=UPI001319BC7B|nr:2'-5' RNA ligase family protein [Streptomyces klenkii]